MTYVFVALPLNLSALSKIVNYTELKVFLKTESFYLNYYMINWERTLLRVVSALNYSSVQNNNINVVNERLHCFLLYTFIYVLMLSTNFENDFQHGTRIL